MAEFQRKDSSIFKEVAAKASIVSVISYELGSNAVIKKGSNYRCVCPFHDDHNPSMQINVAQNNFKCFVDHSFGDPIDFVEKYEHISKIEALKKVCQICSIPLPEELANKKTFVPQIEIQYKRELEALKELGLFYQTYLSSNEGKACRDYLDKRKIPQEAIEHFQLGYAPSDPSIAIQALRNRGFEIPVLEKAGILANSSDWKDRFSNRLMYPIFDDFGHLVGFSGREKSVKRIRSGNILTIHRLLFLTKGRFSTIIMWQKIRAAKTAFCMSWKDSMMSLPSNVRALKAVSARWAQR